AKAGIAVKDAKEGSTWAQTGAVDDRVAALMAVMLDLRQRAREQRDFAASDQIRDGLGRLGIVVQDAKDGATWSFARSAS
ncbi:MAG: cysteine--tRNA ligase, partial [Planctomycetes bacterium]|nr:cysteine--tRNA ligase [Planctomycetota bacterium]